MPTKISTENIQSASLTTLEGPKISNVQITDSGGTVLDDTAVALTGGYIKLTGNGFQSGCQIKIGDALATSVTFVSTTEVRAQVAAASAGTYDVYLVNSDGSYAIRISGLTYSATPSWVTASTLPEQAVDVAISIQLAATGATTYSLQSGSSLPAGVTLSSGGLISGTVTGIAEQTTYNFTVEAIDAELQDSPRAFSVVVTVGPPPGTLWAWGSGADGALGNNSTSSTNSPIQVSSEIEWIEISPGNSFSAGIKSNGTLWLWGDNNYGQLGLNTVFGPKSSPTQVGSATDWNKVSATEKFVLAVKDNGTLWAWGRNQNGQLGLSDTINRSSPVQVGSMTDWDLINSGSSVHSLARKSNGTLWAWGYNNNGQLGLSDTLNRSSPTQIGTSVDWDQIYIGDVSTAAIKTNGTLWQWGNNGSGQLGLNDRISRSSPVQIGLNTDWNKIATTGNNSFGIKTDGTLWGWGNNVTGALGVNSSLSSARRSSPIQVGSSTDWLEIEGFLNSIIAKKTNNTLWSWGSNGFTQLGLNDEINRSSPTQVGSDTNWNKFDISRHTLATKII